LVYQFLVDVFFSVIEGFSYSGSSTCMLILGLFFSLQHFTEITEDQFDFHTYCLRKFTLRSYVSLPPPAQSPGGRWD